MIRRTWPGQRPGRGTWLRSIVGLFSSAVRGSDGHDGSSAVRTEHRDASGAVAALQAELDAARAELAFMNERYQLMIVASNIGLWDLAVTAGDPVNPASE